MFLSAAGSWMEKRRGGNKKEKMIDRPNEEGEDGESLGRGGREERDLRGGEESPLPPSSRERDGRTVR